MYINRTNRKSLSQSQYTRFPVKSAKNTSANVDDNNVTNKSRFQARFGSSGVQNINLHKKCTQKSVEMYRQHSYITVHIAYNNFAAEQIRPNQISCAREKQKRYLMCYFKAETSRTVGE